MQSSYRRVLLKLSGESIKGKDGKIADHTSCMTIASPIKALHDQGVDIGIVIGGGNIFRGQQAEDFDFLRTPADHIGMLATALNGLLLQQTFLSLGCKVRVMSSFSIEGMIERYHWKKAKQSFEKGYLVIFVGGTGNPYFTTDSAAALRAAEIDAEVLIKGTKVDGVFTKDPQKYADATRLEKVTYEEVLTQRLNVMDATAIALCRENKIPIQVIDIFRENALSEAILEKKGGTIVRNEI